MCLLFSPCSDSVKNIIYDSKSLGFIYIVSVIIMIALDYCGTTTVEIWWRFAAGLNHSLSAHRAVILAKSSTLNDVCNELVNQWHIWINRRKSVNYKRYFWSLSMQPYAINLLSYWHMSVIEKCHWKVNVGVNSKLSVHPITLTVHSYNNTSKWGIKATHF